MRISHGARYFACLIDAKTLVLKKKKMVVSQHNLTALSSNPQGRAA